MGPVTTLARTTGLSEADETAGILRRPYRMLTIGIVACVLLIAFEATAVNTAMPVAARALHGVGLYAFAFTGFFTSSLLAMVVSGEWCDKRGPLVPLGAGIAVFGVGLVLAGTATTMWTFVAGRVTQGLGGGLVIVALYVVVGLRYPERLRPKVFAAFAASWVLPSVVGPLVSGAVTQHLGWRWVFLSIPALIVAPLVLMLPQLRGIGAGEAAGRPLDRRRLWLALGLAVGAGLLQYASQRLDLWSLVPAAAGAALLVPAALRLLPRGTFRAGRGLPTVILLRGVAAGGFISAEAFIPLMLVTQHGFSPTLAGLSLSGGGVFWAVGSWLQGRPFAEAYRLRLVQAGLAAGTVAIALVGVAAQPSAPAFLVATAWTLGGCGMGLAIASISVLLFNLSEPGEAGANSASLQVSDALGNIVCTALGGLLFTSLGTGTTRGFTAVFAAMAIVMLCGTLICRRARPH
ncbi:MFS transporter [Streptacidiphilus melanogenes]|uniref:MFS transporter n=1 Tax=Streptacidiphilus melanogenes TaxID=411235 RepID=UPI0005A9AD35|nr:MFS transporter [Streptacidiphilus melanogenes]